MPVVSLHSRWKQCESRELSKADGNKIFHSFEKYIRIHVFFMNSNSEVKVSFFLPRTMLIKINNSSHSPQTGHMQVTDSFNEQTLWSPTR